MTQTIIQDGIARTGDEDARGAEADTFVEWLARQGHQIIKTQSSYWVQAGPRIFQAFPYHRVISPTEQELRSLFFKYGAIGFRYSAPFESSFGKISYHAIFQGRVYNFDILGKWARKNVRRGLKNCTVESITFARLAEEGWALQMDTLDRQGRELEVSASLWRQRCFAALGLDGFEAWGALVDGRLAASVITFQMDDCAYMLYQQCQRDYLPMHVNNALSFVVTKAMIERPKIRSILYGLHSLDAPASVDEFKFRMGYAAKPVRQRVIFHPLIAPFFNKIGHAALSRIVKAYPNNVTLTKAEGMFRFYLEGQKPLSKQQWPSCLLKYKEELIVQLEGFDSRASFKTHRTY